MFPVPDGQIGTEGHVDEGHLGETGQGGLEAANRPKQVSMGQLDMGVSHDGACRQVLKECQRLISR